VVALESGPRFLPGRVVMTPPAAGELPSQDVMAAIWQSGWRLGRLGRPRYTRKRAVAGRVNPRFGAVFREQWCDHLGHHRTESLFISERGVPSDHSSRRELLVGFVALRRVAPRRAAQRRHVRARSHTTSARPPALRGRGSRSATAATPGPSGEFL